MKGGTAGLSLDVSILADTFDAGRMEDGYQMLVLDAKGERDLMLETYPPPAVITPASVTIWVVAPDAPMSEALLEAARAVMEYKP